jgi:hypothetical protein
MKNDIIDPRDESLVDLIVKYLSTDIESLKILLNDDSFLKRNDLKDRITKING